MPESSKFRDRVFFLATAALALSVIWPVIMPVGVGAILAFLSEPLLLMIQRRIRVRTRAARYRLSIAFVVASLLVVVIPLIAIVATSVRDLLLFLQHADVTTSVGELSQRLTVWVLEPLRLRGIEIPLAEITENIRNWSLNLASGVAGGMGTILAGTPEAILNISLSVASWIVFAVEGRPARRRLLLVLLPWQRERRILMVTTAGVIRSLFVSNVSVALLQALVAGIILWACGFPRALTLGFIAFFASFVPMLGTALILVPSGLYFLFNGHPVAGSIIALSALPIGLVDNVLRPLFMRGGVDLGFFWILVALFGGVAQFGIAGTLIGPLAFSLFLAAWNLVIVSNKSETHEQRETP